MFWKLCLCIIDFLPNTACNIHCYPYMLLLCMLFLPFNYILLRRGAQVSPDSQRGAWHKVQVCWGPLYFTYEVLNLLWLITDHYSQNARISQAYFLSLLHLIIRNAGTWQQHILPVDVLNIQPNAGWWFLCTVDTCVLLEWNSLLIFNYVWSNGAINGENFVVVKYLAQKEKWPTFCMREVGSLFRA
jgi:hypothetical protein